jgi:hypothetical protein
LLRQVVDAELVGRMRADDGQIQLAREFTGAAAMVNVRVRLPDLGEFEAQALDFGEQHVEVAAGIDHGRFV